MPSLIENGNLTGQAVQWQGGQGVFAAAGTFGGATVKLQFLLPDGTTWADVGTEVTLTAPGGGGFILPIAQIRVDISGGTPSGIYANATRINP